MLATDFAADGLPSSLRKPRAASSFDTPRNDSCPPLGRRRRSLRARATTSGLVSLRGFLPSHLPSRSRLRLRAAASFATLLAFSNCAIAPSTWRIGQLGVSGPPEDAEQDRHLSNKPRRSIDTWHSKAERHTHNL